MSLDEDPFAELRRLSIDQAPTTRERPSRSNTLEPKVVISEPEKASIVSVPIERQGTPVSVGAQPNSQPPPAPGKPDDDDDEEEEQGLSRTQDKGWKETYATLKTEDEAIKRDYDNEIDTLLVFAGLFSAVLTAFIVEVYQRLEEDNGDLSVKILRRISEQLDGNTTTSTDTLIKPPPPLTIVAVNILWFASLLLSLFTALFGILVKQWIRTYSRWSSGARPVEMLSLRDFYSSGFDDWHVSDIVAALPTLLQIALLLFVVGLSIYLWTLNTAVAIVVTALTSVMFTAAIVTIILPVIYTNCPYKSPLGLFILALKEHRFRPDKNNGDATSSVLGRVAAAAARRFSSWRDWDLMHIAEAAREFSDPIDQVVTKIGLLLDIRPRSKVDEALVSDDLNQSIVGFRTRELGEFGLEALFDLIFSSASGIAKSDSGPARGEGLKRLLECSASARGKPIADMVKHDIRGRWPDKTTSSSHEAAMFVAKCSRAWTWSAENIVSTTCLYHLNVVAEQFIEELSTHDVPHDIATYRDRLYEISSVMQYWLSLASSITHPQVTKAMDLNAELLLLHRTTSVRTDVIHGLPVEISVITWANDGSAFGLGCPDGLVQVWQVSNITRTAHMRDPHANPVRAVAFSPDHSLIASGSNDGTIYVWDIASETIKHTLFEYAQDISAVAFCPEGRRIVCSAGPTAHVWDIETCSRVVSMQSMQRISAVAFSADGKRIACGTDMGPIRIYDAQTGEDVTELRAPAAVVSLKFGSEGYELVSRHRDNATRTWNLASLFEPDEAQALSRTPAPTPAPTSVSSLLTVGLDLRSVYARNDAGDEQTLIYRLRPGERVTSTIESHGKKVVFGTLKGRIVLLDYVYVFPPYGNQ